MQQTEQKTPLDHYLGKVRPHLPITQSRDILMELESTIRDRVDDLASELGRQPDDEMFEIACAELGEPEAVASGYVEERYLIGPHVYRSFLLYTGLMFALHMVMIGVSTALERPLEFGLLRLDPLGVGSWTTVLSAALSALFTDIGVMVVLFTALGSVKRFGSADGPRLRVDCTPRVAYGSAVLALVVLTALTFFRDEIFVVVNTGVKYPMFSEVFHQKLPVVTGILLLAAMKDTAYGFFGERRSTLALDALHGVLGVAAMLYLLNGDSLLALPHIEAFQHFHAPVSHFLGELSDLMLAFLALMFGVKTVKRLLRFGQI